MGNKSEKTKKQSTLNKSLLFAIEDVAKLLRTEVKKKESHFTASQNARSGSSSPDFVNNIEQIAKLLRLQVHASRSKKKRAWRQVKP
jgi:hypothetical protein